jgi:hypothetical protein
MGLIDSDFTGHELSSDVLSALDEGKTAFTEVFKLRGKNTELLGEKKAIQEKYRVIEEKLISKGLSIEALDTLDLNASNDEQLKRFQSQLETERNQFKSSTGELSAKLELANKEREQLLQKIEQSQIKNQYQQAAKVAGVDADFADDYYSILQARGVQMYVDQETGEVRGKRPSDVVDYTLETLITNFKADPTHQRYFAGKFGGGSGLNPSSGRTGTPNPFHPDTFNLTEQSNIYRQDPARAIELQRLANS